MTTTTRLSLLTLLGQLRTLDVRLAVDGERLTVSAPSGALSEHLRAEITARKSELLAFLREAKDRRNAGFILERAPRDRGVPLSFAQQRLWFLSQLNPGDPAYNLGAAIDLPPEVESGAVEGSLRELARRHEVLRSVFGVEDGIPLQFVTDILPVLHTVHLDLPNDEDLQAELERRSQEEVAKPFQLDQAPAFRAMLLRPSAGPSRLVMVVHHILADAWSMGIMVGQARELCVAPPTGVPDPPPMPWQYADYAYSQARWFERSDQRQHVEYWRTKLGGNLTSLNLPTDRPRERVLGSRGSAQTFTLDAALSSRLRALAQTMGGTPFTILLSVFKTLLHRYSGQTDILLGTPVANRNLVELEPLVGMFVSTMVLRTDLSGDPSFRELHRRVRDTMLEAHDHGDFPFEKVVELVRPDRSLAHSPLFQVAFILHNAPLAGTYQALGAGATYELNLFIWDGGQEMHGALEYNTDLFGPGTIGRMIGHLTMLADAATAEPDTPISRLAMLTGTERTQLIESWNATVTDYPRNDSIVSLFEGQVDATPDAIAVVQGVPPGTKAPRPLTYRELDRHANRLAQQLGVIGVGGGSTVGILLNRSLDFVVAALATLKAGAAYVPIDPAFPRDRQEVLLADAGVSVLLTRTEPGGRLPEAPARIVCLRVWESELLRRPDRRSNVPIDAESLAYVMYTSGSTGQPKAIAVPHRAVVRLVRNTNYIDLSSRDTILACAPVSFDASTFEIWGSLLNGGRLVMCPDQLPTLEEIARLIRQHAVTTLWLTAGLFHLMVETQPDGLRGLRHLLAGGDVLSPLHARRALRALGGGVLINGYGPTENTTFTCCHRMAHEGDVGDPVPIGRPIANTRVYLLDEAMQPVPVGVRGELWTGGDGLALGYRNDPELTRHRFVRDPFSADPSARMYRTGDIARYWPDGTLEFLGRADNQIKIRGFRVEPGEVEAALHRLPTVSAATVVAYVHRPGDRRLVAYIVPAKGPEPSAESVKAALREHLPEYAVPSWCVFLPALPLSANGKVDYDALPAPRITTLTSTEEPDALETQLIVIWEQVLGVSGIGLADNFFDLGGNSLVGLKLLADLEKVLGRRVPVSVLYQGQTVESMASVLRSNAATISHRVIGIQPGGKRPPLFVVPGINGNVIGYEALARALGPDQPLYGLRSVGLDGEAKPLQRIETIAATLIPELQRIQPTGPYHLLGFCMGGMVAYEMARQLTAYGHSIALLGLLDTWPPEVIPRKARLSRFGQQLRFIGQGIARHGRAMWRRPRGQRFRYLREKARIVTEMLAQRDVYRGDRHLLFRDLVTRANQRAAARYTLGPYSGDLLLILSSGPALSPEHDPRTVWMRLTTGTSHVLQVPGLDSGSLLRPPYVQGLAEILGEEMTRAQRPGPSEPPDRTGPAPTA